MQPAIHCRITDLLPSIATCWPLTVGLSVSVSMQDNKLKVLKSKISSLFPNLDIHNAWQMGHNLHKGLFSWARTVLFSDFAAWIDMMLITQLYHCLEIREHA